jgi:hypothetical protein
MVRRRVAPVLGGLVLLAAVLPAPPAAQTPAAAVCALETSERIVAVGDVHGAHDRFLSILRTAGIVDRRDRWTGGRSTFIQMGDVLDRGADSRKTIDFLRRLERDARSAGGRVVVLAGNHEFMRLVNDWRYVSPGEYRAFRNADSVNLREVALERSAEAAADRARAERRPFDRNEYRGQFMKDVPLGFIEMRLAFATGSDYGDWVRRLPAVARVNGILFVHGGISGEAAALGCAGINERVAADMQASPSDPVEAAALLSGSETGPLWYRGMAQEPEEAFAPALESILRRLEARAVVVGHTPTKGRVAMRFAGRVVVIDSGMLGGEFFPGGAPSALEIQAGSWTAIYLDRREPLGAVPGPIPTS